MKQILFILYLSLIAVTTKAQSFEVMPGNERLFIDAQFLSFFDQDYKWSLFSRARATANYDDQGTDLFTAGYLNHTFYKGFGVSLIGRVASRGSGVDAGVHYVFNNKSISIFALPSINIGDEMEYSWFSIVRYTPRISENWKIYSSVELFSSFRKAEHVFSVQRWRVGLDWKAFQFGLAANLSFLDQVDIITDENWGIFIRKAFN
jgi:hypothetical protein